MRFFNQIFMGGFLYILLLQEDKNSGLAIKNPIRKGYKFGHTGEQDIALIFWKEQILPVFFRRAESDLTGRAPYGRPNLT